MNIGIITHHYVKNYGAYLQAYALINKINEIEPKAEVELVNKVVFKHYALNIYRRFKIPRTSKARKVYFDKIKQFNTLTKYEHTLPISKIQTLDKIKKRYNKIIVGSDEVWNYKDYSYSPIKFGYGMEGVELYSYAASAGEVLPDMDIPEKIKDGMKNFKIIGVRDRNTLSFANRVSKSKKYEVLDPTLIYDFSKEIKDVKVNVGGKYILIYGCKFTDEQRKLIIDFAKENNLLIIGAGEYEDWYSQAQINLTPFEWVSLFRDAHIVLTGTFHGLMFSLKFKKDFICMPVYQNRINKTKTILEELELTDRLLVDKNNIDLMSKVLNQKVNYDNATKILNNRITESRNYLMEVLKCEK